MRDKTADAVLTEFRDVHRRFRELVTALDAADINRAPAPGENTVAVLAKHALGAERFLLYRACDRATNRVRDEEFRGQMTKDEILRRLDDADRDVAECAAMGLGREGTEATGRSPTEMVVHAVAHAAEHLAQAELTRTLLAKRASVARRIIDISHPIEEGMETYRGLPVPKVDIVVDYESSRPRYDGKAEFLIANLHLCGNTGTYVDSPHHRYPDGKDVSQLPLESLADLPVELIDARKAGRAIAPETFTGRDLNGKAVLVLTGFARNWRTDAYFKENPFLTRETSEMLATSGASFVGIDSLNIDDIDDKSRPAHTLLLRAGIPVGEHFTNLERVSDGDRLHAAPIPWVGGATFPVRAYVIAR